MKTKSIFLCDLDAFFAAVEMIEQPQLRDRPVVVGGRRGERGVVSTANYLARTFGIHSAMSMTEAERRCPHAVFLPVRHTLYKAYARRVFAIYEQYTPWVESISIDEAFLDMGVTGNLALAAGIKQAVHAATGLTVSIGVGPNKFLAKLACELAKPDGLKQITQVEASARLAPLAVSVIPGIGPKTSERLQQLGIHKIEQLRVHTPAWFTSMFGKRGPALRELCFGRDRRPVTPAQTTKSISDETTFARDLPASTLRPTLRALSADVGRRLRAGGYRARTIGIKVRLTDFQTKARSQTQGSPLVSDEAIFAVADTLFQQLLDSLAAERGVDPLLRLLGVHVSNLVNKHDPQQLTLFD